MSSFYTPEEAVNRVCDDFGIVTKRDVTRVGGCKWLTDNASALVPEETMSRRWKDAASRKAGMWNIFAKKIEGYNPYYISRKIPITPELRLLWGMDERLTHTRNARLRVTQAPPLEATAGVSVAIVVPTTPTATPPTTASAMDSSDTTDENISVLSEDAVSVLSEDAGSVLSEDAVSVSSVDSSLVSFYCLVHHQTPILTESESRDMTDENISVLTEDAGASSYVVSVDVADPPPLEATAGGSVTPTIPPPAATSSAGGGNRPPFTSGVTTVPHAVPIILRQKNIKTKADMNAFGAIKFIRLVRLKVGEEVWGSYLHERSAKSAVRTKYQSLLPGYSSFTNTKKPPVVPQVKDVATNTPCIAVEDVDPDALECAKVEGRLSRDADLYVKLFCVMCYINVVYNKN